MFEPIDEEISEIQVTSWTDLEGKMRKAHQQETVKLLPDYPENSNMEMETTMK